MLSFWTVEQSDKHKKKIQLGSSSTVEEAQPVQKIQICSMSRSQRRGCSTTGDQKPG